jgi:hypothetical protein
MDNDSYTAEQHTALTAANLKTGRVPLYYDCAHIHGRLPNAVIQGLIDLGLVIRESTNRLVLTDLGHKEAERLLAADVIPGF